MVNSLFRSYYFSKEKKSNIIYMPYHIRKLPNQKLYKVYDKLGKPLSKKGLSMTKAKKQIIAVNISEFKKKSKVK